MEFSIKVHTFKSELFIDIERLQVIISKTFYCIFLSLKVDFVLANRADTDEMWPYAAFHLGLHCLP